MIYALSTQLRNMIMHHFQNLMLVFLTFSKPPGTYFVLSVVVAKKFSRRENVGQLFPGMMMAVGRERHHDNRAPIGRKRSPVLLQGQSGLEQSAITTVLANHYRQVFSHADQKVRYWKGELYVHPLFTKWQDGFIFQERISPK